jgi:hypothetical protein
MKASADFKGQRRSWSRKLVRMALLLKPWIFLIPVYEKPTFAVYID